MGGEGERYHHNIPPSIKPTVLSNWVRPRFITNARGLMPLKPGERGVRRAGGEKEEKKKKKENLPCAGCPWSCC